ncbi:MAG: FtsX-like permease family protein [Cyclobacteriaceae bacterium]
MNQAPTPPNWILCFLHWFCPDHLLEEIEGDLVQKFEGDVVRFGLKKAKRKFVCNVIRYFRSGIVMRNNILIRPQAAILANYFKTSIRHIGKSKVNFTFKLGGLTLAIFSFMATSIYVSYQWSVDSHHKNHENIYRVNSQRKENGQIEKYAITPVPIGEMLKQNIPEVNAFVRINYANGSYLRFEDKVVECEGLIEADSSLFNVLTFSFLRGSDEALKRPNAIVLTETKARELFGSIDVLEKIVTINDGNQSFQVTAVIENSSNSCFNFEAVIVSTVESRFSPSYINSPVEFLDNSPTLFIRFNKPFTDDLTPKIENMLDQFVSKKDRVEMGFSLSFQPITDVYFGPHLNAEFARKGNSAYVYAFSIMGILLLIIAGINHINLSIADFSTRARETGVRKVLGARRHQLIMHVLLETLALTTLSIIIALLILYLLFPQINQLLDPNLRFTMLANSKLLLILFFGLFTLTLLSGWFPARQFSESKIAQNLKSNTSSYSSGLNQTLLLIQFSISAICIICTMMAGKQLEFINKKKLGIDRNNLLVLSMPEHFTPNKMQTFKNELKSIAGVDAVSNSSFRIGGGYWKDWYFVEKDGDMVPIELYEVFSDDELFKTLRIKVLKGRTFRADIPYDSGAAFVINETAARELGWDDPIGKRIYTHPEDEGKWDGTVVGLVADVNISPLYEKIQPLVMRLPWQNEYPEYFVYVRYEGEAQSIIKSIEELYNETLPGYPLAYRFVDEFYNSQHRKESKVFASLQFGTYLIALISLVGIFSLGAYISIRRMKEFGIRKVLGATMFHIAHLHLSYFARLLLIASIISIPLAFWLVRSWLDTFAYRTDLTMSPFILSVGAMALLVIVSAGYSSWKSGRMNPVDAIKMG